MDDVTAYTNQALPNYPQSTAKMQTNSTSFLRGINTIFFDLDNTLVPTRRADERTLKEVRVFITRLAHVYDDIFHVSIACVFQAFWKPFS